MRILFLTLYFFVYIRIIKNSSHVHFISRLLLASEKLNSSFKEPRSFVVSDEISIERYFKIPHFGSEGTILSLLLFYFIIISFFIIFSLLFLFLLLDFILVLFSFLFVINSNFLII